MDKDYLIKKWLADELSPEEAKAFEALEDAPFYKDVIDNASAFRASQFSTVADYQKLNVRLKGSDTKVKKITWIRPLMRIASVFVLGFALYYFFFNENLTKIHTRVGEKVSVILPDNSSVKVNALSEIAYNEKRWGQKREVNLKGEAFFDVAIGAKFDVVTPKGTVSVLGTEFNVLQRGSFFEVRCFEGTVKVNTEDHEEILEQGGSFRIIEGIVTIGKNMYNVPQWTKNISDFQRVAVAQVFAELERQYGVIIIYENVNIEQLFTGGFVHDGLDNALRSITEPLDLEYTILPTNKVRVKPREK
ncbi:FecR family protein [Eudoraea adriatica]|uniref:FecR family protein n=1 Tax=Eudoraea adriatica TaxID=446681 RepID=UPI0003788831|nr:FecR family protein [Eudoraea adriatica]